MAGRKKAAKRRRVPPLCGDCFHLYSALRTDFRPHMPEFFCGEPTFLPLDSNKPGPCLGFVDARHEECLALGTGPALSIDEMF